MILINLVYTIGYINVSNLLEIFSSKSESVENRPPTLPKTLKYMQKNKIL